MAYTLHLDVFSKIFDNGGGGGSWLSLPTGMGALDITGFIKYISSPKWTTTRLKLGPVIIHYFQL